MKIFCIGRNYTEHAKELNNEVPSRPLIFMKPPTALLKGGRDFYYPDFSSNIHHELELVIRICKNGKHVQKEFAHKYVDQITVGIDLTARDLQSELKSAGHPWEIAKGFDGSAILGEMRPFQPSHDHRFELKINDQTVQSGTRSQMIFDIETQIVQISKYFTLQQGDLIYTGTPSGVGPINIGDKLEATLDGEVLLHCQIK